MPKGLLTKVLLTKVLLTKVLLTKVLLTKRLSSKGLFPLGFSLPKRALSHRGSFLLALSPIGALSYLGSLLAGRFPEWPLTRGF